MGILANVVDIVMCVHHRVCPCVLFLCMGMVTKKLLLSHYKIYTNGYVTFGLDFDGRYPDRLNKNLLAHTKRKNARARGFAMLAPLWTDNDARHGDVYYHMYDLTQPESTSLEQARVMVC